MQALLVRAHETDTNAWYPVATSQPRASAVRRQCRGINAHHRLRREGSNLGYMSKSSCGQEAGGTRNDEAGSGAARTAQRAPGYVSGWSNVAISKGGANVGRIILREQERNLNVIGRKHKGGWKTVNG
jgi:hypothetical protein